MGRGEYGRLGLGPHIKQADKLVRIDSLEEIISVSACSAVSFAVDSKGEWYKKLFYFGTLVGLGSTAAHSCRRRSLSFFSLA